MKTEFSSRTGEIVTRRLDETDDAALLVAIVTLLHDAAADVTFRRLQESLSDPHSYLFMALENARPVGYLSGYRFPAIRHDGYLAYLYDLHVAPWRRGRGIAKNLVDCFKAACRADGVRQIWAGTERRNMAARHLFMSTGAKPTGEDYLEFIYQLVARVVPEPQPEPDEGNADPYPLDPDPDLPDPDAPDDPV